MTAYKQARKEILAALLMKLRSLLASPSDSSLARTIGISLAAVNRINALQSSKLSQENRSRICSFLGVSEEEFERYLDGLVDLSVLTRNVKQVQIVSEEESVRALEILKKEVLPKITFPECMQAMRLIQAKFWSLVDNNTFSNSREITGFVENATTIAELLKNQDLDVIAQRVNLDRARLGVIARGEQPRCEELTLLSASLGIPIKDLEALRKKQFDKDRYEQPIGDCFNG